MQNYEKLKSIKLKEENEIRKFGIAWMKKVKGIHIVSLEGDDFEMGYQYGKLLKNEALEGAIDFFTNLEDYTLKHSSLASNPIIRKGIKFALDLAFRKRMSKNVSKKDLQFFLGMQEAFELPSNWAKDNSIIIDYFMYLPSMLYGKRKNYLRSNAIMGCTSFGTPPEGTENGHTISGHNKDFTAMEYWDKYPVITSLKPKNGYRYIHVSGAGIPSASIVSMNEYGLVFSSHVIFANDVGFKGYPIFMLGDYIMKTYKTTEDVVNFLKEINTMSGWKFHIIDKTGKIAIMEITNTQNEHYYIENSFSSCVNLFKRESTKKVEMSLSQSMMNNYISRQTRIEELGKEYFGKINPEIAVKILGDRYDIFTKTTRSIGNIIAQMSNVSSVVFDHTEMNVWVADGKAPVCNNVYRGFTYESLFTGDFTNLPNDIENEYHNSDIYKSVREYIYATNSHFIEDNYKKSVIHLSSAENFDKEEPIYPLIKGLLLMQLGEYNSALESLKRAINLPIGDHKLHLSLLFIARCYDILNDRVNAVETYLKIIKSINVDKRIMKSAMNGLDGKYFKNRLKSLSLNFWMSDVLEY